MPGYVPLSRSIISRVKSSFICCNLLGALRVGMVAGIPTGCCMGTMSTAMARLIRDATINQTVLTALKPQAFICVGLLVATLSSVVGVISGLQAYDLARRPSQEDASGNALALAAPVAVLGVAVTGASVGAVVVTYFFNCFMFAYYLEIGLLYILLGITYNICLVSRRYSPSLLFTLLIFVVFSLIWIYSLTKAVIFTNMITMAPSIFLCFLFGFCGENAEFHLSRISVKVPAIVITTVLISISFLRDEHQLVPLLDPANATKSALLELECFFIAVLNVQMFQASCGSVLYSCFVTGGESKICAGAVAAGIGVFSVVLTASPILGTGASLGGLLAVSGAAGVALSAAGDQGQRYGGHVGRTGVVVGAGLGGFLTLASQDVKFALRVALCAAAFPGSPFIVLFVLDPIYTFWIYLFSKQWCWYLCGFAGVVIACISAYMFSVTLIVILVMIAIFSRVIEQVQNWGGFPENYQSW